MEKFLTSNDAKYRLLRTIVQGIIGVLVANVDAIIGSFEISSDIKPIIVAACMAILSPIMAAMGNSNE